MGWKTNAIPVDCRLGLPPEQLVQRLVGTECAVVRTVTLEEAFHPAATYVGEHGDSTILLDPNWPAPIVYGEASAILTALLALAPEAKIAAVQLHSVVNYSSFRVSHAGASVRAFACSTDDDVMIDEGQPLPAENRVVSKLTRVDTDDGVVEYTDDEGNEFPLDALGEEFVLEIFRDLLGVRPDEDEGLMQIPVTEVRHGSKGFWRRLFGAR